LTAKATRYDTLYERLGYRFQRVELLTEALTHPSFRSGRAGAGGDYERLEFVGDRVLGLITAEILFEAFSDAAAGELARRLNARVRQEALVEVAKSIELGSYLHLSRSERRTGGETKPAILADACEAVIAALYLDGGLDVARAFIERLWPDVDSENDAARKDAKTALQEWAHKQNKPAPDYVVVKEEGPPHKPVFTVEVRIEGLEPATGRGKSKRAAQQAAAQLLLGTIPRNGDTPPLIGPMERQ
jgi:ribonuclease-3